MSSEPGPNTWTARRAGAQIELKVQCLVDMEVQSNIYIYIYMVSENFIRFRALQEFSDLDFDGLRFGFGA